MQQAMQQACPGLSCPGLAWPWRMSTMLQQQQQQQIFFAGTRKPINVASGKRGRGDKEKEREKEQQQQQRQMLLRCQRICLAKLCGIRSGSNNSKNNNNPSHTYPYPCPLATPHPPPTSLSVLSLITDNNELPSLVVAAKWRRLWIRISNLATIATVAFPFTTSPMLPSLSPSSTPLWGMPLCLLSLAQCCKIYRVTYETNSLDRRFLSHSHSLSIFLSLSILHSFCICLCPLICPGWRRRLGSVLVV